MRPESKTVTFRNRMAAFLWGFTVVWLGMVATFTWLLFTDGAPEGTSPLLMRAVLGAFWLAGFGLVAWVSGKAITMVTVERDRSVSCTRRYPFRVERWSLPASDVSPAELVESKDSEGDPYFYARIYESNGRIVDLAEAHDRERCENACKRFNEAIGK